METGETRLERVAPGGRDTSSVGGIALAVGGVALGVGGVNLAVGGVELDVGGEGHARPHPSPLRIVDGEKTRLLLLIR